MSPLVLCLDFETINPWPPLYAGRNPYVVIS